MPETQERIRPSKFLRSLEAHLIYDHEELAMDYAREVGLPPPWPAHSAKRAQADVFNAIHERDKGWKDVKDPLYRVAYGWEVAESVAKQAVADWQPHEPGTGMESLFQDAVLSLEEQGK